jgi:hypothetical protein
MDVTPMGIFHIRYYRVFYVERQTDVRNDESKKLSLDALVTVMTVPSKRSLSLMEEIKVTIQYNPFSKMQSATSRRVRVISTEKQQKSNIRET